jgi:hypothetical protein
MANINDFKLINQKSRIYFNTLVNIQKPLKKIKKDKDKERIGFYFFVLEQITGIKDLPDLLDLITDTDFNNKFFSDNFDDLGIDAIYIDEENNEINLFNFKFREKFKSDRSKINEAINSTKFINFIQNGQIQELSSKIKDKIKEIIEKINSNDVWKIKLYVISNEDFDFENDQNIKNLEDLYSLEIINLGLRELSEFISIRPKPINAKIILDKDAVMSFSEDSLSSEKSYLIRIPLYEVVRITSNDEDLRFKHNLEDISVLSTVKIDLSVLFDNVRGFINKSKYNLNILKTLQETPTKFFMYNNGLTIIVKDIKANPANANKKLVFDLKDIQVVNGGQTLRTIHKFNNEDKNNIINNLSKAEILVRIFNIANDNDLANKIAEYTNSQNTISVIDLKSLRSEQIQIEQYLEEYNILYVRKTGDIGNSKKCKKRISMEKFGQILFALDGKPEKASNQKKSIFDKYYEDLFIKNFELEKSVEYINKYFMIREEYLKIDPKVSDQKIFYILYLDKNLENENLQNIITDFEKYIKEFSTEKELSEARKLIRNDFKDFIDNKFNFNN